ncbi:MAG TPA: GGDEF domain-containing protein [Symbiobacteriaceae bacterium]|nr:GGDEF domain-containing protein [Symbiobacteriaceae bacterium]
MRHPHPWQALVYLYLVDAMAVILLVTQWRHYSGYDLFAWISALVFAATMAAARVMPIHGVDANHVSYGWYMAVEFAIIAALPVPLACLAHLPALPVEIGHRMRKKMPEPFRGPDYNVSASIICAFAAGHVLRLLQSVTGPGDFWQTVNLIPVALVFLVVQYLMLQTLVCLDRKLPWHMTGLLHTDGIIGDVMMTLLGALIGRLYVLDRSTILLTIIPLATLQRTLQRMQQAKLALVDSKTELYNYRYLDRALSDEVRKATQSGKPLTLIFGDMDYLRDINNTYGHLAGDRALISVARIFKRCGRPGDVPARFGGEEFVLLMPGTEFEQAWEVAERIRTETAACRLETDDGGVFSVTISLGVASFPRDATTVQGLIKAADQAVYAAKRGGKNKVCAYPTGVAI